MTIDAKHVRGQPKCPHWNCDRKSESPLQSCSSRLSPGACKGFMHVADIDESDYDYGSGQGPKYYSYECDACGRFTSDPNMAKPLCIKPDDWEPEPKKEEPVPMTTAQEKRRLNENGLTFDMWMSAANAWGKVIGTTEGRPAWEAGHDPTEYAARANTRRPAVATRVGEAPKPVAEQRILDAKFVATEKGLTVEVENPEEEAGIKAIIALQGAARIAETEAQARAGWRSLSAHEKEQTMLAFKYVCGGKT